MRKYIVGLTLAIATLFAFTACGRDSDTAAPTTEPEPTHETATQESSEVLNQSSDEWIIMTAKLNNGISISIPGTWLSYEHIPSPGGEPFRGLTISSSEVYPLIEINIFESPISNPLMIVEGFSYSEQFQFDDGFVGYMLENNEALIWLHSGDERFGILQIDLWHNGNRGIFTDNEDLILRIVRSLRNDYIASTTEIAEPSHTSNPFAAALFEYFAGGMSQEDMHAREELIQASWMGPITKAVLVNIDNAGTPGMLAFRLIAPDGHPVPMLRLFALYNGEVSYVDVGGIYATDMYVTIDGRVVEAMHHWGSSAYTLFGIEGGRLIRTFGIHVMLNDDIDDLESEYSYLTGGLWENAQNITREEFEDIRIMHGLDNLIPWNVEPDIGLRYDETEAILAMIFE
ncbi:MAG: hypothetical protein FWE24_04935 [Defluviitaleaceae bacterium]|nr:hypothetical protein [Defluviitaleaceae bacterium]